MAKYRILEITKINGLGEKTFEYVIQKKYFFFYLDLTLDVYELASFDSFSTKKANSVDEKEFSFPTYNEAEKFVSNLLWYQDFYYKGKKVKGVINDKDEFFYIIPSTRAFDGFEYGMDIIEVKNKIDRMEKNISKKVMKTF